MQFSLKQNVSSFLLIGLLLPSTAVAKFIPDQAVAQGSTLELLIPKFDFTSVQGNFEGKTFPFYEIVKSPNPADPISRGEFLQLIYQNHPDLPTTSLTTAAFADVHPDSQFYEAIQFAASEKIASGYDDGLFHPYDPITRGQAAKIILNTFHPLKTIDTVPNFPDVPADYSLRDQIIAGFQAEVLKGYPDGLMRPNRAITFHEAELIIQRAATLSYLVPIAARPTYRAFLGINRLSELGNKNLTLTFTDNAGKTHTENTALNVTKSYYPSQHFDLVEERDKLFGQDYQDRTWELINAAKANPHSEQLWSGPFIVPTNGEITVGFGDKLYINDRYAGSHFGIDYANREGTPVYAANDGIITMSSDTAAYGNVVIIDHGHNVFTMYLHLHELKSTVGNTVKKGDLIATMGSTGLATGPHLHFTQFVGDIVVNSAPWYAGKY